MFRRRVSFIISVFILASCAGNIKLHSGLIKRLKNRGPVALSADNPYLAANLLVSKEMETSSELKGFIDHRGAPSAIEVEADFLSPILLHFYYPENREFYSLEELDGTWLVSGPYSISSDKAKQLARVTRDVAGEPRLVPGSSKPREPPLPEISPTAPAQLQEEQKAPVISDRGHVSSTPLSSSIYETTLAKLRNETQGLPAETTPKGDLVHYVTYPGENLSMITRWYTDDRANVGRVARINNLENPNAVSVGDTIIIPAYLVKYKQRITQQAVESLRALSTTESSLGRGTH